MTWRERAEVRIGISGMPGVGKTTLALKVAELAAKKLHVCGFVTQEVRERGVRIGFDVVDIASGRRTPLARVGTGEPSVGKYVVFLGACSTISEALRGTCDLLIVDEIGTMEFKCPGFSSELERAVYNSPKVLAVVHRNYTNLAKSLGFEILWLTRDNWSTIYNQVVHRLGLA